MTVSRQMAPHAMERPCVSNIKSSTPVADKDGLSTPTPSKVYFQSGVGKNRILLSWYILNDEGAELSAVL